LSPLTTSYVAWDTSLIQAPLALLQQPNGFQTLAHPGLPNPVPALWALSSIQNSGGCGVTAMVDAESETLYVMNVGDCRAVAGWLNPRTGEWRCDTLTADQTLLNEPEKQR
jgi:hypothetical protein